MDISKRIKRRKSRHERPLVLLSGLSDDVVRAAVDLVMEWEWDLRGMWIMPGEWPSDKPVAGALIGELSTHPLAQRLIEEKCPTVRLSSVPHPDDGILPTVLLDQAAGGCLAAEHFAERGYKNVVYVGYDPENPEAHFHAMYMAFRRRAEELNIACLVKCMKDSDKKEQPVISATITPLADWLKTLPKPVALFAITDIIAARLLLACTRAGLLVPEEVALLGYGNSVHAELTAVQLSSVDPATDEQARTALQLLHRMMEGAQAPKDPVLVPPNGIVERRSTDVLAISDPAIARALRFIWDHFDRNLSIKDIAKAAGIPRRSLERGFRQHLDRSVHVELVRKRVTELRRLLLATKAPLADLAPRAGFFTLANAHKRFFRAYGLSPHKFRARHSQAGV